MTLQRDLAWKVGRIRGTEQRADYCFIQVDSQEIAENAIKKLNGYLIEYAKLSCDLARRPNN